MGGGGANRSKISAGSWIGLSATEGGKDFTVVGSREGLILLEG